MSVKHNLTDTWQGRFAFPRRFDPISFTAYLHQAGKWLSGTVEEPGVRGLAVGEVLSATISGKVVSDTAVFLKTYDTLNPGYDAVRYDGMVGDEGLEISGTWTIPGNWSGSFIMIRSGGLVMTQFLHEEERV
jgi:hypothetical protein